MDLFEEIRKREEDKRQKQELKVQNLRQKLNKVDNQFFENDTDTLIKRRELLNFQSGELQTVFVDDVKAENSKSGKKLTKCSKNRTKRDFK